MTTETPTNYDYDQAWEERWDDMKRYGPYSRHVRRWIHNFIEPLDFTSVLDVGCGQGETLKEIVATYPNVTAIGGVDYSQASVDITRQRLGQGEYHAVDLQTDDMFTRFEQQYDLTISVDVMEHIEDDVAALRNMRRMTRKFAVIGTVQGTHLPDWERDVVGHVRNYQRGELVEKMQSVGFEIDRVVEWGFPFYSPLYRWYLTQTGGASDQTDGTYGPWRKFLATSIYNLFLLNSDRRGDLIFVLAHPAPDAN
ncbi:MAG: class I SAM-dependent methyltransferase [Chloroflexota bacterium]